MLKSANRQVCLCCEKMSGRSVKQLVKLKLPNILVAGSSIVIFQCILTGTVAQPQLRTAKVGKMCLLSALLCIALLTLLYHNVVYDTNAASYV